MNINDLANVHFADVDNDTGERIGHQEKYQRVISKLGYEAVKHCIPYTLDEIKEALPKDEHLNNLSMGMWDRAAGFNTITERNSQRFIPNGSALTNLYRRAGVTSWSPADGVCILKEAARMWAEEDNNG